MSLPVPDAVHATANATSSVVVSFDLMSMWHAMGILAKSVAVTLAVMSVYSLAVTAERLWTITRARRASRRFATALAALLPVGKLGEGVALSKQHQRGYLSQVMGEALREYRQGRGEGDAAEGDKTTHGYDVLAAVGRSVERHSTRAIADLRRGLGGLATISSAAPFVGLLGTVGGIITAFQSMAATGSGGLGSVSAGIAEALITTAFGLFVAIPAVMMFNYFTHAVEAIEVEMSTCTAELVDFLTKHEESAAAGADKVRCPRGSWSDDKLDGQRSSPSTSLPE
jgi:biopolymer transport protein ExbB